MVQITSACCGEEKTLHTDDDVNDDDRDMMIDDDDNDYDNRDRDGIKMICNCHYT